MEQRRGRRCECLGVFSDREGQYEYIRDADLGGGTTESVPGVGSEAYFQVFPTGEAVAIWVLTPRASFSLAK